MLKLAQRGRPYPRSAIQPRPFGMLLGDYSSAMFGPREDSDGASRGHGSRGAYQLLRSRPLARAGHRACPGSTYARLGEGLGSERRRRRHRRRRGVRERDRRGRGSDRRPAGSAGSSPCSRSCRPVGAGGREDNVVASVEKDTRERRPPRARADDEEPHRQDRLTKSIETGTPSRPNFSRSWFSTQ